MKKDNSFEKNGVTFTFVDYVETAPGELPISPRTELRFDKDGNPFHVSLDTEDMIIKMINGN